MPLAATAARGACAVVEQNLPKPAFAQNLTEFSKRHVRNEDQQHDQATCEGLGQRTSPHVDHCSAYRPPVNDGDYCFFYNRENEKHEQKQQ